MEIHLDNEDGLNKIFYIDLPGYLDLCMDLEFNLRFTYDLDLYLDEISKSQILIIW